MTRFTGVCQLCDPPWEMPGQETQEQAFDLMDLHTIEKHPEFAHEIVRDPRSL